jgi:hypothetical protein
MIRNTKGGPNSAKHNDFNVLVFMALEGLEEFASALFHDLWAQRLSTRSCRQRKLQRLERPKLDTQHDCPGQLYVSE